MKDVLSRLTVRFVAEECVFEIYGARLRGFRVSEDVESLRDTVLVSARVADGGHDRNRREIMMEIDPRERK